MSLTVNRLRVSYGAVRAVHDLSLTLAPGGALALLGPNGAGKTASVEAIVGLLPKTGGEVLLDDENISALPASSVVRKGLALVPQWRELFPHFSVAENLEAAKAACQGRQSWSSTEIYELFPNLGERRQQKSGSLSGGEQQMLAIGRALITAPKYLLLDEPSAGLAVGIVNTLVAVIERIRRAGIGILLVEQRLEIAASVAEDCVMLAAGNVVWRGRMNAAIKSEVVRSAYFA